MFLKESKDKSRKRVASRQSSRGKVSDRYPGHHSLTIHVCAHPCTCCLILEFYCLESRMLCCLHMTVASAFWTSTWEMLWATGNFTPHHPYVGTKTNQGLPGGTGVEQVDSWGFGHQNAQPCVAGMTEHCRSQPRSQPWDPFTPPSLPLSNCSPHVVQGVPWVRLWDVLFLGSFLTFLQLHPTLSVLPAHPVIPATEPLSKLLGHYRIISWDLCMLLSVLFEYILSSLNSYHTWHFFFSKYLLLHSFMLACMI